MTRKFQIRPLGIWQVKHGKSRKRDNQGEPTIAPMWKLCRAQELRRDGNRKNHCNAAAQSFKARCEKQRSSSNQFFDASVQVRLPMIVRSSELAQLSRRASREESMTVFPLYSMRRMLSRVTLPSS